MGLLNDNLCACYGNQYCPRSHEFKANDDMSKIVKTHQTSSKIPCTNLTSTSLADFNQNVSFVYLKKASLLGVNQGEKLQPADIISGGGGGSRTKIFFAEFWAKP